MTSRQEQLLQDLVESYVAQAEPISSALLAKRLHVSSATIRNELAALEDEGYVHQPHTSAGRIPTVKGYEFYAQHCLRPKEPAAAAQQRLKALSKTNDSAKGLAKEMAEVSRTAVLLGFNRNEYYYTGLSQLFSQPEFMDQSVVVSLSRVLDVLDTVMPKLQELSRQEPAVLLGSRNPLGNHVSIFLIQANLRGKEDGLCAMLAPLRTDYNRQLGLLQFVKTLWA